jgi:hypothetical protein
MAKPKPKGWNAMSKAKQDAWKKANFDSSTKVTEAQLTKLRQAGTPTAAITKYASDPSMREALNRFYGKDRVSKVVGSSASSSPAATGSKGPVRGGPGAKMPKRPAGGPGSKTGRDGRVIVKTPSAKPSPTPSAANRPGPSATNRPGPSATNRPGPKPGNRPGPSASNRPGPSASNRPGPKPSNRPGPKPSDRPGPKRGSQ